MRPQSCDASKSFLHSGAGKTLLPQSKLPHTVKIEILTVMDQHRLDAPRSVPITFGTSKIALCRDGLTVSTVTLNAGVKFGWHAHAHDQLCVVLEGQYEERCDARAVALRAGSVLWRQAGEMHANIVGRDDVEVILVDIEPERSKSLCLHSAGRAAYFVPGTFDEIHRELAGEMPARTRLLASQSKVWSICSPHALAGIARCQNLECPCGCRRHWNWYGPDIRAG